VIKPTVGRVVLYKAYPSDSFPGAGDGFQAAIVARVWSDTCVNLAVFDANGNPHSRTSVLLVQPESETPAAGYCCWMPYQVGQAAKTEQLEKQLSGSA
jgi:hypothetical protein